MQGRKVLYILGAGASRGAGATALVQRGARIPIPVQADFWPTVLRFSAKDDRREIEGFLFRYFAGYRKTPTRIQGLQRSRLVSAADVEEVFTFLSERARSPSTTKQARTYVIRVWAALVRAVAKTFTRFGPNAASRRIYRDFQQNHLKARDAVVSFNYDTVFENSLGGLAWHYEGLVEKNHSLRLLKPHGSVNWALRSDGTVKRVKGVAATPMLVAPSHLKFVRGRDVTEEAVGSESDLGYLDASPQIQQVWANMEDHMRKAKALVFIGYSFPGADLYFSSVLRSVLATRDSAPHIVLVNPDAIAIASRIKARFTVLKVLTYFDLGQFVRETRKEMLARLAV